MGTLDVSVRFEGLRREDGNVVGKITLRVSGNILGKQYDVPIDARNFSFPSGSEQKIYDQDFESGVFKAKVTATVHERTATQCCVQGHVHVDGPIGGGIGKDLAPNCHSIPQS